MDERLLKVLSRLKATDDGIEFLAYLEQLSKDNYEAFKKDSQQMNDIHKGYAIALDCLLNVFETCDEMLLKNEIPQEAAIAHY